MQTKEKNTNDGGFTRQQLKQLFFLFFFFQLQEAQDQLTEAVRCAEKTQDHIQKYDLKQKINIKFKVENKYKADKQYNIRIDQQ